MSSKRSGSRVWRTAQAGIAGMEGDVAYAVKLESRQERSQVQVWDLKEEVQAVEFLDNAAMATVLVTCTVGGTVAVEPELRFYVQTPQGWQRSAPIAGFWGPAETLDTAHLHFIFGKRDRAVVTLAAPAGECLAPCRPAGGRAALRPRGPGHGRLVAGRLWRAAKAAGGGVLPAIDCIAAHYGIDSLSGLLQGWAQYEGWEELAPAVLGVSAAELDREWHAAMREGAPLRSLPEQLPGFQRRGAGGGDVDDGGAVIDGLG